jgi:hypothetical protein
MLAAVIDVIRLFLMFGGTTLAGWLIVGLSYGETNPMLWPSILFFPALGFTLCAWLAVILVVELIRSAGR